jgi:eukaryotic-like serine/threonine-protein kinase
MSVFGLTAWEAGLGALGIADPGARLRNLAAAELVVEHAGSRFAATRQWAFKHALTREVAYASLGEDEVKESHRLAATWLAQVGEDDLVIAKHMDLGGIAEQSAPHLENAAKRALAINALQQAVDLAERALAFADDKPSAFARAQILDEAWSRLDARAAEREAAVGALEDNVTDAGSAARAMGARARFEDAGGGTEHTTAKLEQVYAQSCTLHAYDEQARTGAALAARLAFAGELDRAETVCSELLAMARAQNIPSAAVDGWQTLAVVRQTRGEIGAALDARGSAVQAAHAAQLLTREATLRLNVGFALTTIGAREQARSALIGGYRLGQTLGAPGVLRHGQMTLLCWSATFGMPDEFATELADARQLADDAVVGSWVPHDRGTLGLLFYRGAELLAQGSRLDDARQLLKRAADAYAATQMLDVVPVALGLLADAERRLGLSDEAIATAERAEGLLAQGSPSLLNEAPVYLALHDAYMDQGRLHEARSAVASGMPRLEKRYLALTVPEHAQAFLRDLRANAALLAAAEAYGILPPNIASQASKALAETASNAALANC